MQPATRVATPRKRSNVISLKSPSKVVPLGLSQFSEIVLRPLNLETVETHKLEAVMASGHRPTVSAQATEQEVPPRKEKFLFSENQDQLRDAIDEVHRETEDMVKQDRHLQHSKLSEDEHLPPPAPAITVKHQVKASNTTNWILSRMGLKALPK